MNDGQMPKKQKKKRIPAKQFGLTVASAFLKNAPLLVAGILLLAFSSLLGKTFLYIGISLCIAYLLSCSFQIVFESSAKGSKFADAGQEKNDKNDKNDKAD